MKKQLLKRAVSLLLSLVLLLGLLPGGVLAKEATEPEATPVLLSEKTLALPTLEVSADNSTAENAVELKATTETGWYQRLDPVKIEGSSELRYTRSYYMINSKLSSSAYGLEDFSVPYNETDFAIPILSYTGTATYGDGVTAAKAVENAAAMARTTIAYPSLKEAARYAAAVYAAYDRDESPFWLKDTGLVGEVVTYTDQGDGNVSYSITTYFYLVKESGGDHFTLYHERYPLGQGAEEDMLSIYMDVFGAMIQYAYHPVYEQLQAVYDWLREKYNANPTGGTSDISREYISVCTGMTGADAPLPEAFARAFKELTRAMCKSVLVSGLDENGQPYMWNLVEMPDEKWYAVDVAGGKFLVGSESLPYTVTNVVTDGGTAFTNGPIISREDYVPVEDVDICTNHVWVNGVDLLDSNNTVAGASYNSATKTLTLNNATLGGADKNHKGAGIYVTGHDAIVLELQGESNVTGVGYDDDSSNTRAAVSVDGKLTIQGTGTLNAAVDGSGMEHTWSRTLFAAVYSGGNMEIKSGTVNAKAEGDTGRRFGLKAGGGGLSDVTISGGKVTADGDEAGIVASKGITISGGQVTIGSDTIQPEYGLGNHDDNAVAPLSEGITLTGRPTLQIHSKMGAIMPNAMKVTSDIAGYTWSSGGVLHSGSMPDWSSTYLATPASSRLTLKTEDTLKITKVETYDESTSAWKDVSEGASYQWYAWKDSPVTPSQDETAALGGMVPESQKITFKDGLWTASLADTPTLIVCGTDLEPGDQIVFTPDHMAFSIWTGNALVAYEDGSAVYTLTEEDCEQGATFMLVLSLEDYRSEVTMAIALRKAVKLAEETGNSFLPTADGAYFAEVTLSGGEKLRSQTIDFARHAITFDPCGGTYGTENATWSILDPLDLEKEPTREGYIFQGWFDKAEGGTKITGETVFTKDTTIYAQWKKIPAGGNGNPGEEQCGKDASCPLAAYTDLKTTAWYHDGVHFAIETELMNGVGGNRFAPYEATSRAMAVTILWRLAGEPVARSAPAFTDVSVGKWYTAAVCWATEQGIVQGYGDGTFGTNDPVTREQMAVFLYRYAALQGEVEKYFSYIDSYVDQDSVSRWAVEAMRWANNREIITGKPGQCLAPKEAAARVETATILQRFS